MCAHDQRNIVVAAYWARNGTTPHVARMRGHEKWCQGAVGVPSMVIYITGYPIAQYIFSILRNSVYELSAS